MRNRGFTLLEVLVALAVFAMAAIVLAASYINVLNAYDVVKRGGARDEEVRFARSLLLAEPDRKKVEDGDDFQSADGTRVRWRATIESTATADLFRVGFVCEITDSGAGSSRPPVTETFMLLRPTWSEGTDSAQLRADAKQRILDLKKTQP